MEITPKTVRELLHYDPETGIFTWRERDHHWFGSDRIHRSWNAKHAGNRAGSVVSQKRTGYQFRQVVLLGRARKEHQLAWLWMTDEPLPVQIDHENRNGTDNRWLNLRASNYVDNSRNRSMRRNNTSGATGVSWHNPLCKWCARCGINGKRHHIGYFADLNEAVRAVAAFRAKHGYDPEHGMEPAHYRT